VEAVAFYCRGLLRISISKSHLWMSYTEKFLTCFKRQALVIVIAFVTTAAHIYIYIYSFFKSVLFTLSSNCYWNARC